MTVTRVMIRKRVALCWKKFKLLQHQTYQKKEPVSGKCLPSTLPSACPKCKEHLFVFMIWSYDLPIFDESARVEFPWLIPEFFIMMQLPQVREDISACWNRIKLFLYRNTSVSNLLRVNGGGNFTWQPWPWSWLPLSLTTDWNRFDLSIVQPLGWTLKKRFDFFLTETMSI